MVDFELSEEQKMVRETVSAFTREKVRPAARQADETGTIPQDLIQQAWELGLTLDPIPEELGGSGGTRSALTGAVIAEELAYGDLAIAMRATLPQLFAFPILEMGTPQQRERYLRVITRSSDPPRVTAAVMEPRFDFDLTDLRTTARKTPSGFSLEGTKCFVPIGHEAELFLIYARLEAGTHGLNGVRAFIVESTAAGLSVGEREKYMGVNGLPLYPLTLAGVNLPNDAILGGEEAAYGARLASESRVALAAMATGVARAAFEYARDYAKQRHAFGAPIATKQAIAFMLAEMALEIDATRLLTWKAATELDKGLDAIESASCAKNYASAVALKVADNAVQILGGHGYIREHPVELWLRNARGFATFEGLAIV